MICICKTPLLNSLCKYHTLIRRICLLWPVLMTITKYTLLTCSIVVLQFHLGGSYGCRSGLLSSSLNQMKPNLLIILMLSYKIPTQIVQLKSIMSDLCYLDSSDCCTLFLKLIHLYTCPHTALPQFLFYFLQEFRHHMLQNMACLSIETIRNQLPKFSTNA